MQCLIHVICETGIPVLIVGTAFRLASLLALRRLKREVARQQQTQDR